VQINHTVFRSRASLKGSSYLPPGIYQAFDLIEIYISPGLLSNIAGVLITRCFS